MKLRNHPSLEICLDNDFFEIKDQLYKDNNAKYEYDHVNSFFFKEKKVNWLISTLSFLANFLLGLSAGDIFKNENHFSFTYKNTHKKIFIPDCDILKAKMIEKEINRRLLTTP